MNKLVHLLFGTSRTTAPLIARIALAVAMFPHGAQKVLGWFGGYGWSGTYGFFTQTMHVPGIFAALAILAEFLGPIGLFVGLGSRIAAFGLGMNMLVAIAMVHGQYGFFMNWTGKQAGEGIEYHIMAIALALIVMIAGAGRCSLDRLISKNTSSAN